MSLLIASAASGCGQEQKVEALPVADAGFDRAVVIGETATLDGSMSYDPGSGELQFRWRLLAGPAESTAVIVGPRSATPKISPDVAGIYVLELIVESRGRLSPPDTVAVMANERADSNTAPVAAVACQPPSCAVRHGDGQLTLIGSNSWDPDHDPLEHHWSQLLDPQQCSSCPEMEACAPLAAPVQWLDEAGEPDRAFVAPNAVGQIVLALQVDDGVTTDHACVGVDVTNNPPVVVINLAHPTHNPDTAVEGEPFTLDASGSDDPDLVDREALTYMWSHEPSSVDVVYEPSQTAFPRVTATVRGIDAPVDIVFLLTIMDPFTSSATCDVADCSGTFCCGLTVRVQPS